MGPDDAVELAVLLDLFVQVAGRRCFHELRTVQRLGYSVSLRVQRLQHVLGAAVRIQSPSTAPAALQEAVVAWLTRARGELEVLPPAELQHHQQASIWGPGVREQPERVPACAQLLLWRLWGCHPAGVPWH